MIWGVKPTILGPPPYFWFLFEKKMGPNLHLQNKAPEQPMKAAIPQQADFFWVKIACADSLKGMKSACLPKLVSTSYL